MINCGGALLNPPSLAIIGCVIGQRTPANRTGLYELSVSGHPSWWHVQAEMTPDGVQTACRTTRQGRMTQLKLPALPVFVTGTIQYPETQP